MLLRTVSKIKLHSFYFILVQENASFFIIKSTLKCICMPFEIDSQLSKLEALFDKFYFSEVSLENFFFDLDNYVTKNYNYLKNIYLLLSNSHFLVNQDLDLFFKK